MCSYWSVSIRLSDYDGDSRYFFTGLTVFCWLKGCGKWGSNYMEQVERWIAHPDSITYYKSKLINKREDLEISEDISSSSEPVYKGKRSITQFDEHLIIENK